MKAIRIVIHGQVQGVFFRKHTEEQARKLNILGTVRNLPSGSVEVIAQGEITALDSLTKWCFQGSPSSKVESVEVFDTVMQPFSGFRTIR